MEPGVRFFGVMCVYVNFAIALVCLAGGPISRRKCLVTGVRYSPFDCVYTIRRYVMPHQLVVEKYAGPCGKP